MLVSTNYSKTFGFFIHSSLKIDDIVQKSDPTLAFYWINNNTKLVTSQAPNRKLHTNAAKLIVIKDSIEIPFTKSLIAYEMLDRPIWSNVYQDASGYPVCLSDMYCFVGGELPIFELETIEFFKVNI